MPANYDLSDLQPLLPFTSTDDGAPFPWQASAGGDHVLYLADDKGLWLRVPDERDDAMDFEAVTGFRHGELERKKAGGIYIYALKGGAPLLLFPFTAAQLVELDRRTAGVFSEGIYCGDETDELIAELPPKSAELARAVVYGELPPEQDATPAPVAGSASNAPARDFSMLATRSQLIDGFGSFTGIDKSWFKNLKDTPALLAARKDAGQGGRGHIKEPWFCPFEVMQWLADSKRRKGRKLRTEKAWELLEKHFPKVYNAYSVADPRAGD